MGRLRTTALEPIRQNIMATAGNRKLVVPKQLESRGQVELHTPLQGHVPNDLTPSHKPCLLKVSLPPNSAMAGDSIFPEPWESTEDGTHDRGLQLTIFLSMSQSRYLRKREVVKHKLASLCRPRHPRHC